MMRAGFGQSISAFLQRRSRMFSVFHDVARSLSVVAFATNGNKQFGRVWAQGLAAAVGPIQRKMLDLARCGGCDRSRIAFALQARA